MPTTLLIGLLCVPAFAQDARVLVIGNSYTQANDLHLGLEAALEAGVPAWSDVLVKALTQGGATLADHAAMADGTEGDTAWRQELVTGEDAGTWRWVILQDQSQIPGFPQSQAEWQASRDGALVLDGLIEVGGAETVLLLTWGRRSGDELNPDRFPDFPTMQARLLEGYQAYADACAADGTRPWIVPAGLAFQHVYDGLVAQGVAPESEGTAFFALYQADGSHPSAAGSYLAALTAVAALTGRDGAAMSPPEELDDDLATILQEAARATVIDDPLGAIDYPWVFSWGDWYVPLYPDIDDTLITPLVYLDLSAGEVPDLRIGVADAGRLWLLEGAELTVRDELILGLGGKAELRVMGGSLAAQIGRLDPYDCADATLRVDGGCVVIGELTGGNGATVTLGGGSLQIGAGDLPVLQQTAGDLSLGEPSLFGSDYTLPTGASLTLVGTQTDRTWLFIDGDAAVLGDLVVEIDPALVDGAGHADLVAADSITFDPASVSLPPDTEIELRHSQGGDTVVLNWNVPCDDCEGEHNPFYCACSSGSRPVAVMLPLLGLAFAGTRRHRGSRRHLSH